MDFIPINYYDHLSHLEGVPFSNWFIYDWENYPISYHFGNKYKYRLNDIYFTVGDDHIELTDCDFKEEPYTSISHTFEGSLKTLFMIATIRIKDGILGGKMCIRNKSSPPKNTDFELCLEKAVMKMTVGLLICGDSLDYDHCKYKFPKYKISFHYTDNSQNVSVFDKITDPDKRQLLQQFMLEYITKDLGTSIEFFMLCRLGIKQTVSELVQNDYKHRNILRIHNRWLHKAFNNLITEIVNLSNSLIQKESNKLFFKKILGLSQERNDETVLKIYKGFLTGLNSLRLLQNKNVIVSDKDDTVFLHAPVEFEELCFHFTEVIENEIEKPEPDSKFNKKQTLDPEGCYFVLSLKRVDENKVHFELIDFRIKLFIWPVTENHPVCLALDYLILHEIEEAIKSYLIRALADEKLQKLAIKPDIEIEYYEDDFEMESSDDDIFDYPFW